MEKENKGAKAHVVKGRLWKPVEDEILKTYVQTHGEGKWSSVSKKTGLKRDGKSCRLRWKNYLAPNIKRGMMSQDEEDLIMRMHKLLGNRWSLIAGRIPGRTDNEVKNYWNSHMNKRCSSTTSSKRRTIDLATNPDNDSDRKKKRKTERALSNSNVPTSDKGPTGSNIEELKGKDHQEKEEKDSTAFANDQAWIQPDAQGTNHYVESSILEKEENSSTAFADDALIFQQDAHIMNHYYNIESPILVPADQYNNNAMFVFDDDPFLAYWDSFVLFESLGCSGEETYSQLDTQSFMPSFMSYMNDPPFDRTTP